MWARRPRVLLRRGRSPSTSSRRSDGAVLALSGAGARSVKLHSLIVYLDKELTLVSKAIPLTRSVPMPAPQSKGAARTQRSDEELTSRQRRSRRRLEDRIAQCEEQWQPQPRGGDVHAATLAATGRVQGASKLATEACRPSSFHLE